MKQQGKHAKVKRPMAAVAEPLLAEVCGTDVVTDVLPGKSEGVAKVGLEKSFVHDLSAISCWA